MLLTKELTGLLDGEEAATSVEYAIMIALIVLAIVQTVVSLGFAALDVFNTTAGVIP